MDIDETTILRAWKDESYRAGLTEEERASLRERALAADGSAITDEQLEQAAGGTTPGCFASAYVASAAVSAAGVTIFERSLNRPQEDVLKRVLSRGGAYSFTFV